jgi:pimeloyl-ACP methyl ester carboxylesterase
MEPSKYKTAKTGRGVTYNYFLSPPVGTPPKPYILFLHGFPSTSYDWHHQVDYFVKEGYGVIVPDMLGYGGTDQPTDVAMYKARLMVQDLVDVLDGEGVDKVIVIAHDWGCYTASRFWNYHGASRILAIAFLAAGYLPPGPLLDIDAVNTMSKQIVGYEILGYQLFFVSEGAEKKIEAHIDAFMSIIWPSKPELRRTDMAPVGAIEAWITNDRGVGERAPYLSAEELEKLKAPLVENGFSANLNWYKNIASGQEKDDDAQIAASRHRITVPSFFGAAMKDYICLDAWGKAGFAKDGENTTVKEYDSDHWVQLAKPAELNADLGAWLQGISFWGKGSNRS